MKRHEKGNLVVRRVYAKPASLSNERWLGYRMEW